MIKTDTRFFDDLAKVATGAVGALSGLREQIHTEIRAQINRLIVEMDFVPRADFELVEDMARDARLANQKLEKRIAALEAQLSGAKAKTAPAKKKAKGKTK
jgi:BMFP domain-containing protein YqiC